MLDQCKDLQINSSNNKNDARRLTRMKQTCQRELCRPAKENYADLLKRTMQNGQRELCRPAKENYAEWATTRMMQTVPTRIMQTVPMTIVQVGK